MARRVPHRKPGRPSLLTPAVEDVLVAATRAGAPMLDAAANAGISVRVFERWMMRGREEQEARDDGEAPDPEEQPYVDLNAKVMLARAQFRVRAVANIQRSAQGGIVTETTTRRYPDPETGEMVEEVTVKRTAPDWKASAFLLERLHRGVFGRQQEVTVTGADGGPVQVEHSVNLEDVAARIHAALVRDDAPRALPGLVEAEVVEEQNHANVS